MINLRKLKEKDACFMIEWMKDPNLNCFFSFDANNITYENTIEFILKADIDKLNSHYAIVDEADEYLGTISLKNIDNHNNHAEYAISLRACAIGKGVAAEATQKILDIAFNDMNLNKVYLNVLSDNNRAIRFYEKMGFTYEGEFIKHIKIKGEYKNLKWYSIFK